MFCSLVSCVAPLRCVSCVWFVRCARSCVSWGLFVCRHVPSLLRHKSAPSSLFLAHRMCVCVYTCRWGNGGSGRLGHGNTLDTWSVPAAYVLHLFVRLLLCGSFAFGFLFGAADICITFVHASCLCLHHLALCRQPRRVDMLHRAAVCVVEARCGYEHCGVCSVDGSVWMWGLGEHGQLGLGNTESRSQPTLLQSLLTAQVSTVADTC